jgi:hypothetical protein
LASLTGLSGEVITVGSGANIFRASAFTCTLPEAESRYVTDTTRTARSKANPRMRGELKFFIEPPGSIRISQCAYLVISGKPEKLSDRSHVAL